MSERDEPQLIGGKDSSGNLVAIKVLSDGSLSGAGAGGGSGDASAAKQDEQTQILDTLEAATQEIKGNFLSTSNLITGNLVGINQSIGSKFDSSATSDAGAFNLIQLFKRLLEKFTSSIGNATDSIASTATANVSLISLFKFLNNSISAIQSSQLGVSNDSYPTNDNQVFNLLSGLRRIVQRLTELIQIKPANTLPEANDTAIIATLRDTATVVHKSKISITGFTSTSAANNNLLDSSGNGNATDVRDYQSGMLTVVGTSAGGSYVVQCAFNSAFTIGSRSLLIQEIDQQSQNPIIGAISTSNSTRSFLLNLQGVNYIRILVNTPVAGVTAYAVLNQASSSSLQLNVQQATAANLNANINSVVGVSNVTTVNSVGTLSAIGISSIVTDVATNTISITSINGAIPTLGLSYLICISISAVSGTNPFLQIDIQESVDNGTNWFTVYSFVPIIATGVYFSPKLPYTGNRIRYVQNITGTSPSFTRNITRLSYNDTPSIPVAPKKIGGIAITADLPVYGRILKVNVGNQTGSVIYLQVFNKATALTNGDIPVDIYPVPANSALVLGCDAFGNYGTYLGVNARLGLSSTFTSYTAITPLTNTALFVDYI